MFTKILESITKWIDEVFGTTDISKVDLSAELDMRALEDGRGLNWRVSLVDFLTLIGVDSSSESRAELGKELGVEGTSGDAAYNEALRVAVFEKLKENGGNVPTSLM